MLTFDKVSTPNLIFIPIVNGFGSYSLRSFVKRLVGNPVQFLGAFELFKLFSSTMLCPSECGS